MTKKNQNLRSEILNTTKNNTNNRKLLVERERSLKKSFKLEKT